MPSPARKEVGDTGPALLAKIPGAEADADGSGNATADVAAAPVSLAILTDAKAAQGAHGMKHGDYARYRAYCTRRLLRMRRATKLQQGRGRFAPRPVEAADAARDARALAIPLAEAERAWAAAMEIKKEFAGPLGPGKKEVPEGQLRRRVIGRLKRAVQAAERLRVLCVAVADEQTVLEAEAYAKWMVATLELEREEWAKALGAFEIVGKVYAGMIAMLGGSAASGVFEERADEVATAVRFCRYNLNRSGGLGGGDEELLTSAGGVDDASMLGQKIDAVLATARKKAAQNLGHVEWCGTRVPLRSEPVREAIVVATQSYKSLRDDQSRRASVDAYDSVFIAYNEAIQLVNRELTEFRLATTTSADERIAELELLVAYLTHGRISHTIDRNILLVESFKSKRTAKPEDLVRLYDNLVQNMSDILSLAGVDTDAATSNHAEARRICFRSHRCFHLAECYRVADRLSEAGALYDHVAVIASQLSGPYADDAANIVAESRGMKCRVRANEFIAHAAVASELSALSVSTSRANDAVGMPGLHAVMIDHLDAFVSFAGDTSGARAIVDIPPALEAVPCKPVLFDLAVDGIRFPELPEARSVAKLKQASMSVNSIDAGRTNGEDITGSERGEDVLNIAAGSDKTGAASGTYFSRWFGSAASTK
jgi:signal recognition particle subunit SRP68